MQIVITMLKDIRNAALPPPCCHRCDAATLTYAASVIEPEGTRLDYYVCERDSQHRTALRRRKWFGLFIGRPKPLFDDDAENAFSHARGHQESMARVKRTGWTDRPR
jgi:hypothetical protein